jgi:uncharacterized membrane protein
MLAIGNSKMKGMILGVILYGLLSLIFALWLSQANASSSPIYSNIFGLSGGPTWADLILSLIFFIPFYFGVRFGPWVGLVVAVIGALPVDFLVYSAPDWYWYWYWIVGSAALGFIPGLAFIRTRGVYNRTSSIMLAIFLSFIGIVVWNTIRAVGISLAFSERLGTPIDFGGSLSVLPATILIQLIALIPFVILLMVMQRVTKAK